ncbi:hypothetical protein [Pseudomonas nicosulfuronedens]
MIRKLVFYIAFWLILYDLPISCYASDLTAKDFFSALSVKELEEVEIEYSDKEKLIESKFSSTEESCTQDSRLTGQNWYVKRSTEKILYIKNCAGDQSSIFYIYKTKTSDDIALSALISGVHGEARVLNFYSISADRRIISRSRERLSIAEIWDNELLSAKQKFPPSENKIVPLMVDLKDGSIQALPWTWMEPRWASKKIMFDVRYAWNGSFFEKKKTKIKQP